MNGQALHYRKVLGEDHEMIRPLEIRDHSIAPIHAFKCTVPKKSAQQDQSPNHTSS